MKVQITIQSESYGRAAQKGSMRSMRPAGVFAPLNVDPLTTTTPSFPVSCDVYCLVADPYFCVFQSAIFNFQSLISVILLFICTCAYVRSFAPKLIDRNKEGWDVLSSSRLPFQTTTLKLSTCYCLQTAWYFLEVSSYWWTPQSLGLCELFLYGLRCAVSLKRSRSSRNGSEAIGTSWWD